MLVHTQNQRISFSSLLSDISIIFSNFLGPLFPVFWLERWYFSQSYIVAHGTAQLHTTGVFLRLTPADKREKEKKKKKGKLTPAQAILQVLSPLHGPPVIFLPEVPR